MNDNRSVATIDAPEFINLQENAINPGISKCEVKVFYLGKNRNGSFINKNTAIQMANSLPGTPIVGAYRKDIQDFGDHGHVVHIENGEVQFSCKTVPYGFVAPDARCWFKKFDDIDEFGNVTTREYLMTTGYLWTDQYPEIAECIAGGKGQSMELDPETMDGHWATDNNDGIEFFIINDAIFSKLCVLGDDVEPCFEGASVIAPEISKNFAKNEDFAHSLYKMMKELSYALQNNEGGSGMPEETAEVALEENATPDVDIDEGNADVSAEVEEVTDDNSVVDDVDIADDDASDDGTGDDSDVDFACADKKKKYSEDDKKKDKDEETDTEDDADDEDEDKKPKSKHSVEDYAALQAQFEDLKAEIESLRQFKLESENAAKLKLINQYFMIDDKDKAQFSEHLENYTCEQLEKELALLYVKQNVNFDSIDGKFSEEETIEEEPALTFSLDDNVAGFVPPVVEALRQTVTR